MCQSTITKHNAVSLIKKSDNNILNLNKLNKTFILVHKKYKFFLNFNKYLKIFKIKNLFFYFLIEGRFGK